ncbi:MAG: 3-hydroxyacyl-CoA dehydrogenase family protein [Alphaproteobacteria bacterium]
MANEIGTVGVLGAGQMGLGIAQVAASAGLKTILVKATPGDTEALRKKIDGALAKAAEREKDPEKQKAASERHQRAMAALTATSDFAALAPCDIVIESIIEDVATKHEAFSKLDGLCGKDTIFASNTSTLGITEMAVKTKRPYRFIGLHFFNPAPAMKLVEIGKTVVTDPAVVERAKALCVKLGKTPVILPDTTGFVVNRLLVPYMLDAMRVWQEGTGSIADIDTAMMNGAAHPMGPFSLADFIGLDVVFHMANNLLDEYSEPRFAPPPVLRRLMLAGQLGRKTGKGFYDYAAKPAVPNPGLSR